MRIEDVLVLAGSGYDVPNDFLNLDNMDSLDNDLKYEPNQEEKEKMGYCLTLAML